jgi:hypothetical protein
MFAFIRASTVVALLVASASVAAQSPCEALDQAVTERLKPLIERYDARSTALTTAAISDLGWARLHCREGRLDRAEAGYRYLLDVLAAMVPPSIAKLQAPPAAEASPPP